MSISKSFSCEVSKLVCTICPIICMCPNIKNLRIFSWYFLIEKFDYRCDLYRSKSHHSKQTCLSLPFGFVLERRFWSAIFLPKWGDYMVPIGITHFLPLRVVAQSVASFKDNLRKVREGVMVTLPCL